MIEFVYCPRCGKKRIHEDMVCGRCAKLDEMVRLTHAEVSDEEVEEAEKPKGEEKAT